MQESQTRARWPLVLWASQGLVPLAVLIYGGARLLRNTPQSKLLWPAMIACTLWLLVVALPLRSPRGRRRLVDMRLKLLSLALALGLCSLVGEVMVRALCRRDADGNYFYRRVRLLPYRTPVEDRRKHIETYLRSGSRNWDPQLGWRHEQPIRTGKQPKVYAKRPAPGVLRVCILGDSFTYGAEVAYEDSWGYVLQESLRRRGTQVEVLNFGVGAYGMDQAYLRWEAEASQYSPALVIFGILPVAMVRRNGDMLRINRPMEGIPFTKPRFVEDGDGLRVVNQPTLPPERILGVMENLSDWPLMRYEFFHDAEDYERRFYHASKLITLAVQAFQGKHRHEATLERELALHGLSLRITRAFRDSVEATGADFVVVHFPDKRSLLAVRRGKPMVHAAFLERVAAEFRYIDTTAALSRAGEATSLDALFAPGGHYGPAGNRVAASVIEKEVLR